MGLFSKIKKLSVFSGFFSIDEDFFEELEESLILADMGMDTTMEAVEELRKRVKERKLKDPEEVKVCLREILVEMLNVGDPNLDLAGKPAVLLMIGVNGVGKTTTIGKLAHLLKGEGNRVLLAAGDTFRAAAADQLSIWADRAQVEMVRHEEGSDPAAVVFDAMNAARARKVDVVLVEESLAVVRVLEEGWGGRIDFTDVLLLLKMDGEWKCVAKAYNQNSDTVRA